MIINDFDASSSSITQILQDSAKADRMQWGSNDDLIYEFPLKEKMEENASFVHCCTTASQCHILQALAQKAKCIDCIARTEMCLLLIVCMCSLFIPYSQECDQRLGRTQTLLHNLDSYFSFAGFRYSDRNSVGLRTVRHSRHPPQARLFRHVYFVEKSLL